MTHPLRSTGITPLQHYKETDSPPQLDSDEATMTYERFIRCGSAKPVANYYEAVRPSPAHRYFRPRGWSRLRLVWGFACQGVSARWRTFIFHRFLCSIRKAFLRPDPRFAHVGARRSCQGWPSHQPSGMLRPFQAIP